MIQCTCGKKLFIAAGNAPPTAEGRRTAIYGIATVMGWKELSNGSWSCAGCLRVERRVLTARTAS